MRVGREYVICFRHYCMARRPALGVFVSGRESVRRGIIGKLGVCPSVCVRESLAILLDGYADPSAGVHNTKVSSVAGAAQQHSQCMSR